ncbi:MAG: hypothetical protein HGB20_04655 [Chlorobiaceae bacterium]|nr:hypothetical protein [Chlorobiaceae bacterium]
MTGKLFPGTARNSGILRAVRFLPVFVTALIGLSTVTDAGAAITCQIVTSKTVGLALSDFGLSTTASVSLQTGITSVQLNPLDIQLSNSPVTVPVSVGGTVTGGGLLSKTLETSYSDYIWRLRMTLADKNNFNTGNEHETYAFASSGSSGGTLAHTTTPVTATIPVTIVPGVLQWNQSGNTYYLIRTLNLQIDLSNVRYSGTYRSTFTTTVFY